MSKEPINAVLLVGDKSEANTDMMVANYDPTNQLNIMSIPRDTKVILGNGKA